MLIFLIVLLSLPIALFSAVCLCALVKRPLKKSDCIIVLGAKVHPDGSMSNSLRYRCEAALSAWQRGCAGKIILCGGKLGEAPCSEAGLMRSFLLDAAVPDDALIMEDQSRNTVENLKNARQIMIDRGFADAAIVTSDYHLQRAIWIARKFSIRACGIPAKSPSRFSSRMKNYLRECVSWVVFWHYELKTKLGAFSS